MKYHNILLILSTVAILGSVSQANAGLVNGSFETGNYAGWTLSENSGDPTFGTWGIATTGQTIAAGDSTLDFFDNTPVQQTSPGLPLSFTATQGNYLAYQLQNGGEIHRMYQDVSLDSDAQTLSWDMGYTNHAGLFDDNIQFLTVQVLDLSNNILATLFKTNVGDNVSIPMTNFIADISAFAGQTVRMDVTLNNQLFWMDSTFDNFIINPTHAVPESTTLALLGLGLAGLTSRRRNLI